MNQTKNNTEERNASAGEQARNFTPGPWSTQGLYVMARNEAAGIMGTQTIARAFLDHPVVGGDSFANARLIAAAPELLASLAHAVRIAERDANGTAAPKWTAAARAAIDKATGASLSPETQPQDARRASVESEVRAE